MPWKARQEQGKEEVSWTQLDDVGNGNPMENRSRANRVQPLHTDASRLSVQASGKRFF